MGLSTPFFFVSEFPLLLIFLQINTIKFLFTRKSFVKLFLFNFIREFLYKLIGDLQQQILQKNPLEKIICMEILCKILPILKLEIEFHSHKKVVSPKLENSAHFNIMNFKCEKFQPI